jgi:CelD/BcsL family acetyltransferase involved in cellulose biosynthesis
MVQGYAVDRTTSSPAGGQRGARTRVQADPGIDALAREWDALADRTEAAPFLRPGWVAAWWSAFGVKGELELITRRGDAGELAGVLPIIRTGATLRSPTNDHTPVFGAVCDEEGRAGLYESLLAARPRLVEIGMLAADGPDPTTLHGAAGAYTLDQRTVLRSPYVAIDGDWDAYWSSLSQNLRGTVRRCRNRLRDLGTVELEVHEGGDGLDPLLEEAFTLEATGWKGAAGTAITSTPETERFYRAVAAWAAEHGLLRLSFLRVDGRAVAFHLGLETPGAYYLVKLGHDAALNKAGPGTVITASLLERAFECGLRSFEFLGEDDPYKMRWGASVRERVLIRAFAPTLTGRAEKLVQVEGRAVARTARDRLRTLRHEARRKRSR